MVTSTEETKGDALSALKDPSMSNGNRGTKAFGHNGWPPLLQSTTTNSKSVVHGPLDTWIGRFEKNEGDKGMGMDDTNDSIGLEGTFYHIYTSSHSFCHSFVIIRPQQHGKIKCDL